MKEAKQSNKKIKQSSFWNKKTRELYKKGEIALKEAFEAKI